MVEKLTDGALVSKPDKSPFDSNEEMARLFVLDYLQHRKLFYTMSVLKVESTESSYNNQSSLKALKRHLLKDLEDNDPLRNILASTTSENKTLLEKLIHTFKLGNTGKGGENNGSGLLGQEVSATKLGINVQTQTSVKLDTEHSELDRNLNLPMKENNTFSKELVLMKPQDEAYQATLQRQKETSSLSWPEHVHSRKLQFKCLKPNVSTLGDCNEDEQGSARHLNGNASLDLHEKRIKKAQQFLNLMDSRLSNIATRFEKAVSSHKFL